MIGQGKIDTYPGLASFQDRDVDRLLFCGRDEERRTLLNLVIGESICVLYSRSGLGKTSLINATLLHALRQADYFPVVARLTDVKAGPRESVIAAIRTQAATRGIEIRGAGSTETLWEYLVNAEFHGTGGTWKLVLILDQFEELFSRIRERDRDTGSQTEKAFIEELSDVVRHRVPAELRKRYTLELEDLDRRSFAAASHLGKTAADFDAALDCCDKDRRRELVQLLYEETGPNVKVLLSLREDYLPELEALRQSVPTIFQKMMRLDALTLEGGREAIIRPAQLDLPEKPPFTYEPQVVESMLAFLQRRKVGAQYVDTGLVDPGQLQILCQHLDRRRRERGATVITKDDLGGDAGMQRILRRFYRDILRQVPGLRPGWNGRRWQPSRSNYLLFHLPRVSMRMLVQKGLITRTGHRNSLMVDTIVDQYGVTTTDLWRMVDAKLIRAVTRLESQFYELMHDTLIGPIRAAARARRYKMISGWVLALSLAWAGFKAPGWRQDYREWRARQELVALASSIDVSADKGQLLGSLVTSSSADPDFEKSRNVMALIEGGQRDFNNEALAGVRLSNVTWRSPSLVAADLKRAKIERSLLYDANLSHAQLRLATVRTTTFLECIMVDVDATETDFSGSIFVEVDMTRLQARGSDFRQAKLYDSNLSGADLTDANLESVDFAHVDMTGVNITGARLDGTAWWNAFGWSAQQWKWLSQHYSAEKLRASPQYRSAVEVLDGALKATLSPGERASALNARAWFRAARGAELELALQDAEEAVNYALHLKPEERAAVVDTRGYVLLQMKQFAKAIDDFELAVSLADSSPPLVYHLALAYEAAGRQEQALEQFARAEVELGYSASYERLLTPRQPTPRRRKIAQR